MTPLLATIFTGLCLLFGAFSLGVRHILSDPAHPNYPSAPSWRRKIMWGYMLMLAGVGVYRLLDQMSAAPFQVDMMGACMAGALAVYHGGEAVHVLRQRLPAYFWRRIARAEFLTHCGADRAKGAAMGALSLDGVPVAAPGELPEHVPGLMADRPSVH